MDSFAAKALWSRLTSEHKKAMVGIAADWQADKQPEDVQMEDTSEEPAPPSSSSAAPSSFAPPLPVHCTMTMGEAHAHYMDMVREERFREAQTDANYNHNLLQEHLQAEEQVAAGRAVTPDADLAKFEVSLESYRSTREIRLARWRYRQRVAEVAAAGKECDDEAGEALFGKTDEESIAEAAPRRHDHEEAGTSAGSAGRDKE